MMRPIKTLGRKWRLFVWWWNKRRGDGVSKLPEGWEQEYLRPLREADEIQFHKESKG